MTVQSFHDFLTALTPNVICGDALSVLKNLPTGMFDLVLADPPYGATQNHWDRPISSELLWPHLTRICKGAIVLTAIQPYASELVTSGRPWFRHEWVWSKNKGSGHLNCSRAPLRYHEHVLVFARDSYVYNPQMTVGHKPGNYAKRRTATSNYGAQKETEYGGQTQRYPRSIQEFAVVNNDSLYRTHPTQKPVDLFRYLIRTYSNPGNHVLDFCAGSGTTGVAARMEGRFATLIELDPEYCEAARQRVSRDPLL